MNAILIIYGWFNCLIISYLLPDAEFFFNAHLELYNCLTHSILQSFTEGQKCFRGDR